MCCAFNFASAENIFIESKYTKVVTMLQTEDAAGAFENRTLPGGDNRIVIKWILKTCKRFNF